MASETCSRFVLLSCNHSPGLGSSQRPTNGVVNFPIKVSDYVRGDGGGPVEEQTKGMVKDIARREARPPETGVGTL